MKEDAARYTAVRELGRGAFGRVVLGVDERLRRTVALKLLDDTADADAEEAFLEEAIITGRLEHPNIIPTYDLGRSPTLGLFYAMKQLPGRSLRDEIDSLTSGEPGLGFFRRATLFADICRAMVYAHDRRVIHTDLKPENVLIGAQREVVVADWGLAIDLDAGPPDTFGGTPSYMSPEQATGAPLDERTDVWSLGVILFELLTLRRPFEGGDETAILEAVLTDAAPVPSRVAPAAAITEELDDICRTALAKHPRDRFQRVDEMLAALDTFIEGTRERQRREDRAAHAIEAARRASTDDEIVARLSEALDAHPSSTTARAEAAAHYWRMFARGGLDAPTINRLSALARRALPEVLRAQPSSTAGDPWLEAVSSNVDDVNDPTTRTLVRRVRHLRSLDLFRSLPTYELLGLAEACREVELSPHARIFETGQAADALYLVIDGAVDIDIDGATVARSGIGEVFGEVAVLGDFERTAGASASAAGAVCLVLEAEGFRDIVRSQGAIGLAVIEVLTRRLRSAAKREARLRE